MKSHKFLLTSQSIYNTILIQLGKNTLDQTFPSLAFIIPPEWAKMGEKHSLKRRFSICVNIEMRNRRQSESQTVNKNQNVEKSIGCHTTPKQRKSNSIKLNQLK